MPGRSVLASVRRAFGIGAESSGDRRWRDDAACIVASGLFDREYYLQAYPDVSAAGIDPVEHYVRYGVGEGRRPSACFDTAFYLESNPDVAVSGINPLRHYGEYGRREGRSPLPIRSGRAEAPPSAAVAATRNIPLSDEPLEHRRSGLKGVYEAIAESGGFDDGYYKTAYPGVARGGLDPIAHYISHGAAEFKNPSRIFNTKFYLKSNPDVAKSGMNPLFHFQMHGWKELRDPSPGFDTGWYWLLHMEGATDAGSPLAHYLAVGKAAGLRTRPINGISASEKRRIGAAVARVLASGQLDMRLCRRLMEFLARKRLWADAESVCRHMVATQWEVAEHHADLARVLAAQGKNWQQIGSLQTAISIGNGTADLHYRLGLAYEAMERWQEAVQALQRSLDIDPTQADAQYRIGYALERTGDGDADAHYAIAISLAGDKDAARFGVGALHQARGRWEEAVKAYAKRVRDEPLDAQLYFRLGMAHDRCYGWSAAEQAYRIALTLEPGVAYWHYRLGFVFERTEKWNAAADAYQAALDASDRSRPYWRYRKAYALMQAGDYLQSCRAFLDVDSAGDVETDSGQLRNRRGGEDAVVLQTIREALRGDYTRADWHYALGAHCERQGDWTGAANAYRAATDRSDTHRPSWYYRLGLALYQQGHYLAACEALRETRIARGPYGVDSGKYENSPGERLLLSYHHYISDLAIRKRTILYESFGGVALACNPLAIFRRFYSSPDYSDWVHVWVVDGRSRIPDEYRGSRNVVFVTKGSDLYLRYAATASHLINNSTFPSWFIRREEQKYLNTWHGTPLKTLGKDIQGNFMERKNTARNFLHATHIISPNRHTTEVLVDRYDLAGLLAAKVAETGYPRVDATLNASETDRSRIRSRLGLTEGSKVVLYAPTWRGTLGNATVDFDQLKAAIETLAGLECQVVFRGHYFSEQQLGELGLPVVIAPYSVDSSELLAITDVLVTDYSSILFDYLPLRRPIVYFAYDRVEYREQRGLYFPLEDLPGDVCLSVEALGRAVQRHVEHGRIDAASYDHAIERYCSHEDGGATERAVRFFIDDETQSEVDVRDTGRKTLLCYAGAFPPNGITTSFLNLLGAVDPARYRVVVVIDPDAVEQSELRMERFSMLPDWVQVVARTGRLLASPEERWVISRLGANPGFREPEMWRIYLDAHAREFRRMFGGASFDGVMQFDGYSLFWAAVLLGADDGGTKTMYLHNDMRGEAELKFPYLRGMFRIYQDYDALVSVSETMRATNLLKLSSAYGLDESKFRFAENAINHERIIEASLEPLDADLERWMRGRTTFLTMGRMSPEKDHAKLIRAFKQVAEGASDVGLVLLGDGPLRGDVEQLIRNLGLEDSVFLAGQRSNPFPALRACDCFVLSSNHEGQPMVLLEAMTLGKAIVATDIDGNRGVLATRDGTLVENCVEGLTQGMLAFLAGQVKPPGFDPVEYRRTALGHFDEVVTVVGEARAHPKN